MDLSGYLKEYVRITLASIRSPNAFFMEIKEERERYLKPLAYLLISITVYIVGAFSGVLITPQVSGYLSKIAPVLAFVLMYFTISIPLLVIPFIIFQALLMHLAVRLVGGKGKFYDTFKVFCYAYSPLNVTWLFSLFSLPMILLITLKVFTGTVIAAVFLLSTLAGMLYIYYITVMGLSVASGITRLRAFAAVIIQIILLLAIILIPLFGLGILHSYTSEYNYSYSNPYNATPITPTAEEPKRYDATVYLGSAPYLDGNADAKDKWYEGERINITDRAKNYTIILKHDFNDLYILMELEGQPDWRVDTAIFFEQDEGGPDLNLNTGRVDFYGFSLPNRLYDFHYYQEYNDTEAKNGKLAGSYNDNDSMWRLEWQIPMKSGDEYDIYIDKYPTQLGFSIVEWRVGGDGIWPQYADIYKPETWGNITIVDKRRGEP